MSTLFILEDFSLVPVIELEPWKFSAQERQSPSGTGRDMPREWERYWLDALADAGITGLRGLRPGSWHVPTRGLNDPGTLKKILAVLIQDWGGSESLSEPGGTPVFDGGLAFCYGSEVLVEPTCCVDLGCAAEWRAAVDYRESEWKTLWIGHPWLSFRFDKNLLILSEPHESDTPLERWAVTPEDLDRAVTAAEVELEDFARRLQPVLEELVGKGEAATLARKLAGLVS